MSHHAQGSNTLLAPKMRAQAMSKGKSTWEAEARATTMKEDQMRTVITAAKGPMLRWEKTMSQ